MATTFIDDGTDATQDFSLWSTVSGSPVSDTGQSFTGPRSIKLSIPGGAVSLQAVSRGGVLADAGRRITFRFRYSSTPSTPRASICFIYDNANGSIWQLRLGGTSTPNQLRSIPTGGTAVDGSATLSPNTWYRITVAYTITNTTTFEFRVYVDGVLDSTANAGTLTRTGSDVWQFSNGSELSGDARDHWYDNTYIDDGTGLGDPGDIRVTAKRPFGNGNANQWTTQIGSGGSGYGFFHSQQVNERPLDEANGWSIQSASLQEETYELETAATGDVDISGHQIADYMGWVRAKAGSAQNANLIINGVPVLTALTTAYKTFQAVAGSTTYPAGSEAIGMDTNGVNELFSLAECGILIAYRPVVAVSMVLDASSSMAVPALQTAVSSLALSAGVAAGPAALGQVQGAAPLAVTSALGVTGLAQLQAAVAALVAAIGQVSTGQQTAQGQAGLGAVAAMTPAALANALGLLALAAAAGLTPASTSTQTGQAGLAAAASLTPEGRVLAGALLALAAEAQLAAIAADNATTVTVTLAAQAAVTLTSLQLALAIQAFLTEVGLTAAPQSVQAQAMALAILAELQTTGQLLASGGLALALAGLATTSGQQTGTGPTSLSAAAAVSAAGAQQSQIALTLSVAALFDVLATASGDPTIGLLAIVAEALRVAGVSSEQLRVATVTDETLEPS